jgi:hypothetical protein
MYATLISTLAADPPASARFLAARARGAVTRPVQAAERGPSRRLPRICPPSHLASLRRSIAGRAPPARRRRHRVQTAVTSNSRSLLERDPPPGCSGRGARSTVFSESVGARGARRAAEGLCLGRTRCVRVCVCGAFSVRQYVAGRLGFGTVRTVGWSSRADAALN